MCEVKRFQDRTGQRALTTNINRLLVRKISIGIWTVISELTARLRTAPSKKQCHWQPHYVFMWLSDHI